MSTGGIVLLVYSVGGAVTLLPAARYMHRFMDHSTDAEDLICTIVVALFAAAVWPLVIPGAWLYHVLKMDAADRDRENH